jgi:hypothetical protein
VQSWLRHFESDLLAHVEGEDLDGMEAVARAFSRVIAARTGTDKKRNE